MEFGILNRKREKLIKSDPVYRILQFHKNLYQRQSDYIRTNSQKKSKLLLIS